MSIASLLLLVGQLFCSRRHDSVSLLSISLSRFFIDVCFLEYSYAFNLDSTCCTVKQPSRAAISDRTEKSFIQPN